MVEIPARPDENGAPLEIELAEVPPFAAGERINLRIRDDAPVPAAEHELATPEPSHCEHAFALCARTANLDVAGHSASANAVSHAAT